MYFVGQNAYLAMDRQTCLSILERWENSRKTIKKEAISIGKEKTSSRKQGQKTVRITVRLEPEMARQVVRKACERDMTPSAYLRMLANQKPIDYPEIREQLNKLITEVNRIGVNINQIVKNHNSSLYSNMDKKNLSAYMQKLNLTLKEVVSIIGNK